MDLHEVETSGSASGSEVPTEHPHIVKRPGICGGSAIIRGTRITVRHIAFLYNAGENFGEILANYPHLQPSWAHDAISYYLDHKGEIDKEIENNQIEIVLQASGLVMDEKGVIRMPGPHANGR